MKEQELKRQLRAALKKIEELKDEVWKLQLELQDARRKPQHNKRRLSR